MSHGSELKSPAAEELRRMGYRPLPRWWVLQDELEAIERMASKHRLVVKEVREKHRKGD